MGRGFLIYNFKDQLTISKGNRSCSDEDTIRRLLAGTVSVVVANENMDKIGVDYIATIRGGAQVFIDIKTREIGCSKYWRSDPELAIEKWSVMPGGKYSIPLDRQKAGWTIDESKITDMVLYVWHPSDSKTAYLLPFQSLRMATRANIAHWMGIYKTDIQDSGKWQSQAVFVPASVVISAINLTFIGRGLNADL